MQKRLQLTLLLSCVLMLCSHSINAFGTVDFWSTVHSIEERFSDIDNHDVDGPLSKTGLFIAFSVLGEQRLFSKINGEKLALTYGYIRAPPKYTL